MFIKKYSLLKSDYSFLIHLVLRGCIRSKEQQLHFHRTQADNGLSTLLEQSKHNVTSGMVENFAKHFSP